ncbi:MAG: hypothetical protein IH948_00210 [Bacteroidetes bacterium]|nr:hypothetical protein [Bacteroidota bacterium]
MEIIVKVAKIDRAIFIVKVTSENFLIIRKRLELEKKIIIEKFREFEKAGLIKSIFYPSNKRMQKQLDDLVLKKRTITRAIETIKQVFKQF